MRAKTDKPLHGRLQALLQDRYKAGVFDQVSLAKAIGKDQTTVGHYLRGNDEKKAGTLDLDEAASALQHVNSSLGEFMAGAPPRTLTAAERAARDLVLIPEMLALITDLLRVPQTRRDEVLELARGIARLPSVRRGGESGGSSSAGPQVRRTKSGPKKRR